MAAVSRMQLKMNANREMSEIGLFGFFEYRFSVQ
jgi:hypothetical protein